MGDYTCNVFFCKRIIFTARKEWGRGCCERSKRGGEGARLTNRYVNKINKRAVTIYMNVLKAIFALLCL